MRLINLSGKQFGRLTVIKRIGSQSGDITWLCLCECGKEKIVLRGNLKSGNTKSCGCYIIQHGHCISNSVSPTYGSWSAMKARCNNKKNPRYAGYGGRDIKICEHWLNSFENFLADMGERPPGTTLERKNNNGDYEPDNCCWGTSEQQYSNKRNNHFLTYRGQSLHVSKWERQLGFKVGIVASRLRRGWTVQQALSIPRCTKEKKLFGLMLRTKRYEEKKV